MTLPPSMVEEVVQKDGQSRKHASGVAEETCTKSGASSNNAPLINRLAQVLSIMKCARRSDRYRQMEVWSDDIKAVEDAIKALDVAALGSVGIAPDSPTPEMFEAAAIEWTKQCHGYPYDGSIRSWEKFFGALFTAAMKAAQPGEDASAAPTDCLVPSSLNPVPPREPVE